MSQTWLITGSSRGFGRELAARVLAPGDNLVATARRPADLDRLVGEYGDRVRAVAMDDPPLRLLLGASAVESAVRSADERTAEARRWAALSRAADFPADFPADLLTAGRPTARP
jgi:NAD(P)-dependent dehydrogenase (short-subunit alcohol dehydrogenase family)